MTAQQLTNPDALVKRINRSDAMRRDGRRVRACSSHSRQHPVWPATTTTMAW